MNGSGKDALKLVGAGDVPALLANAQLTFARLPRAITDLADRFAAAGYELALVGGPVRDAFLGVVPHDFDLTTSARPEETEQVIDGWADAVWDVGRAFGTIAAKRGGVVVEITTYRTETYEPDSRKPEVEYGTELEGDLSRRDFTVNAVAMRLPQMALVDPFDGLGDLAKGYLRTPVSAEQSFDDDPLRMMRAARFTAQLGIDVDLSVMNAMEEMAPRLQVVSAERVRAELERLMVSPYPRRGLELLVHTGLVRYVLPELAELAETVDERGRHKDVYQHSLTVLEQAIDMETGPDGAVPGPDFVLRFAALMHDIGKPATRQFEPGGVVTFHHHEIVGARITRRRMKALKFDKATIEAVNRLISLHLRFHGYGERAWSDSAVRRYVADAGPQLERLHRLTRADCTTQNRRKASFLRAAYDDLESRIAELRTQEELDAIRPDLDGQQVMELLSLKPGRDVGRALKHLLALRMEEGPLGEEEARERLLTWWAEQQ